MTVSRRTALAALPLALLLREAAAQPLRPGATSLQRLQALGLPRIDGLPLLHHSASLVAEAPLYAQELGAATAWLRRHTGWSRPPTAALLDPDDFARVSGWPYPVPHAEIATGLVVIPASIESYPGFSRWDLEPQALNLALAIHELGHVIAFDLGIDSANAWVRELFANVFMALYVRAERPQRAALLGGVPSRFRDAGRYRRLAELDRLYAQVGLENYAWFQFQIARVADHLAADAKVAALVAALRREFPAAPSAGPREDVATVLARLDRIRPGTSAYARTLVDD